MIPTIILYATRVGIQLGTPATKYRWCTAHRLPAAAGPDFIFELLSKLVNCSSLSLPYFLFSVFYTVAYSFSSSASFLFVLFSFYIFT